MDLLVRLGEGPWPIFLNEVESRCEPPKLPILLDLNYSLLFLSFKRSFLLVVEFKYFEYLLSLSLMWMLRGPSPKFTNPLLMSFLSGLLYDLNPPDCPICLSLYKSSCGWIMYYVRWTSYTFRSPVSWSDPSGSNASSIFSRTGFVSIFTCFRNLLRVFSG